MNTERTPDQIAAELYPQTLVNDGVHATFIDVAHLQRAAWQEGLQVGAEYSRWCNNRNFIWSKKGKVWCIHGNPTRWSDEALQSIFLNQKYGK
jgi:hypothetical protein